MSLDDVVMSLCHRSFDGSKILEISKLPAHLPLSPEINKQFVAIANWQFLEDQIVVARLCRGLTLAIESGNIDSVTRKRITDVLQGTGKP